MATAIAVAVAACGGGGSSSTSSAPTEEALIEAAEAQAEAVLNRDARAGHQLLSERCQEKFSLADYIGELAAAAVLFETFYGVGIDELDWGGFEVVEFVEGESAIVRGQFLLDGDAFQGEGEESPWVYEDGWRFDECVGLGEFEQ